MCVSPELSGFGLSRPRSQMPLLPDILVPYFRTRPNWKPDCSNKIYKAHQVGDPAHGVSVTCAVPCAMTLYRLWNRCRSVLVGSSPSGLMAECYPEYASSQRRYRCYCYCCFIPLYPLKTDRNELRWLNKGPGTPPPADSSGATAI